MYAPHRAVVVVLMLMMAFLRLSEAMPQAQPSSPIGLFRSAHHTDTRSAHINIRSTITDSTACNGDDDEFIKKIDERNSGDNCKCMDFNRCADENDDFQGLIDERTGNQIIDIKSGCGGLKICCKSEKVKCELEPKTKPNKPIVIPSTEPPPHVEVEPPAHQWECGKRQADGVKILVNGFKDGQTQQGEFPWMVAILKKNTEYVGGGSLVRRRVVLTAGHKVYQKSPDSLIARVGDWDISQEIESIASQNIDVEKILYHPSFNRNKHEYSVAILILKTEAVYGETVAPICLPDPGQNFDGKDCFVSGWGKNDFGTGEYQTIMKKVTVPIVGHSTCQSMLRQTRLGSDFNLHNSLTCAGGHEADACEGDGGSPLVCPGITDPQQLVQVGTVAWGIGCGIVGHPGVYGSIPESMDWIAQTIQDEIGIDIDPRTGQSHNPRGR